MIFSSFRSSRLEAIQNTPHEMDWRRLRLYIEFLWWKIHNIESMIIISIFISHEFVIETEASRFLRSFAYQIEKIAKSFRQHCERTTSRWRKKEMKSDTKHFHCDQFKRPWLRFFYSIEHLIFALQRWHNDGISIYKLNRWWLYVARCLCIFFSLARCSVRRNVFVRIVRYANQDVSQTETLCQFMRQQIHRNLEHNRVMRRKRCKIECHFAIRMLPKWKQITSTAFFSLIRK